MELNFIMPEIKQISMNTLFIWSVFGYVSLFTLIYLFKINNDENKFNYKKDFIKLIINNGGKCQYITKYTIEPKKLESIDILISNIDPNFVFKLMCDYEYNIYTYYYNCYSNNNRFKRFCVFANNVRYELIFTNDYYFTFNSILHDINSINYFDTLNEIHTNLICCVKNNKKQYQYLLQLNNNKSFDNIYTILRAFQFASEDDLIIDEEYIKMIKIALTTINKKFDYEIVLKIMSRIKFNKINYLNQFISCNIFEFIGFEFKENFDIITKCELLETNFIAFFISNLTSNSYINIDLILPKKLKNMISFSRYYEKEKEFIKNKSDLLSVLTHYNKKFNFNVVDYIPLYYFNIEFIESILEYPISTHLIKVDNTKVDDIKFIKNEILMLIHNDKLQFTDTDINNYVDNNEIIKM